MDMEILKRTSFVYIYNHQMVFSIYVSCLSLFHGLFILYLTLSCGHLFYSRVSMQISNITKNKKAKNKKNTGKYLKNKNILKCEFIIYHMA